MPQILLPEDGYYTPPSEATNFTLSSGAYFNSSIFIPIDPLFLFRGGEAPTLAVAISTPTTGLKR